MTTRRILLNFSAVVVLALAVWTLWNRLGAVEPGDPQSTQSTNTLVRAHSPVIGPAQARVTVVEFFDPSCEGCRAFHPFVKQLLAENAGQVRVVMRYAPFHQGSDEAILILEVARLQGRFEAVLEALLQRQPEWAAHGAPDLPLAWKIAADVGLDISPAQRQAAMDRTRGILEQDMADVKTVGIEKTPTFYVNGRPLERFHPEELRLLVQQEIRRAATVPGGGS
jgi:protein-disulfide isomerase